MLRISFHFPIICKNYFVNETKICNGKLEKRYTISFDQLAHAVLYTFNQFLYSFHRFFFIVIPSYCIMNPTYFIKGNVCDNSLFILFICYRELLAGLEQLKVLSTTLDPTWCERLVPPLISPRPVSDEARLHRSIPLRSI